MTTFGRIFSGDHKQAPSILQNGDQSSRTLEKGANKIFSPKRRLKAIWLPLPGNRPPSSCSKKARNDPPLRIFRLEAN